MAHIFEVLQNRDMFVCNLFILRCSYMAVTFHPKCFLYSPGPRLNLLISQWFMVTVTQKRLSWAHRRSVHFDLGAGGALVASTLPEGKQQKTGCAIEMSVHFSATLAPLGAVTGAEAGLLSRLLQIPMTSNLKSHFRDPQPCSWLKYKYKSR